ncbi:bifunctional diguanylate cyclase/phosphodiesterase [Butyrivibrio sp. YAB3001]|uniref:bifunctional diguanylate cyclase/phosphodiesterase n=1 Tax=Butyrivibrio sp. YAB3001 TaxID=1520812 RepID=UPI0008F61CE7|nr:EAL domain-containing protein [Butyrivibrio sp. YAB3001]SFD01835.1 diguanylate cyclase (GGDEF) domain-containing protein [Butyrivibrio sp. YAB3001]
MFCTDDAIYKKEYVLSNIEMALHEGWIEVYYQPLVRSANGRVCAEEALVRWIDPVYGQISPDEFIPILDDAKLSATLDTYVLEQIIVKIKMQMSLGLYIVPISVNVSHGDFYSREIVKEIDDIVTTSGIPKDRIAIEISEDAISKNNYDILDKIIKLQKLGYRIWLDDYGSGNLPLVILQKMDFDMVKINMLEVRKTLSAEKTRVFVSELIRIAIAFGIETAVKGVENKKQVEFFKEIGCAMLQGYYYCKPISADQVFERYNSGTQIGFENPDESEYYSIVSKVSLNDLSFTKSDDSAQNDYFDALPIAILETDQDIIRITRCNRNFKMFLNNNFQEQHRHFYEDIKKTSFMNGTYTINSIMQCARISKKLIVDDVTPSGKTIQILLYKLADNAVSGMSAIAFVVLSISGKKHEYDALTYNYVARALSSDYLRLYFVNIDTGKYVEYNSDGKNRDMNLARNGEDFFYEAQNDVKNRIYKDDLELFAEACTRDNIVKNLDEHGTFSFNYRVYDGDNPCYVNFKAVQARNDPKHIIVGINNIDSQIKQQEAMGRMIEEKSLFSKIAALAGDYIAFCTVNMTTWEYTVYKTYEDQTLMSSKIEGEDFFNTYFHKIENVVYKDDLQEYFENVSKISIFSQIANKGSFSHKFRIVIDGEPKHVKMKALIIDENNNPQLIMGLLNVDAQVKKEAEYAVNLLAAEDKAFKDELTGVKNKHAYAAAEDDLNRHISAGDAGDFAIIVFDLNGLKHVNDTYGHQKGDEFIKKD